MVIGCAARVGMQVDTTAWVSNYITEYWMDSVSLTSLLMRVLVITYFTLC